MDIKVLQMELEKLKALKRSHASFFQWHDKDVKEKRIGLDFFQKLEESSDEYLLNIESAEDPPDVKITTSEGRTIGVEKNQWGQTRLISQKPLDSDRKD